jgi:2-(1,2-epoxy-1,2-dihydrophenyl)acetyl-CoA isomerase
MGNHRSIDTGTTFLLGEVVDGVATLTLNRPERMNALHPEIFEGLGQVLPQLAADGEVGAIVITGTGRAFCAGGDVAAQSQRAEAAAGGGGLSFEEAIADLRRRQNMVSAQLHEHPKVTIAALPGAAAGAGMSIALACDLRIAAESAFLLSAFAKVGFSGDFGGSWFLTQLVGAAKAREVYLGNERLGSAELLRLGLVSRVVPDGELPAAAQAWAAGFAAGPRIAYRYMKENLNRAVRADLRTCLDGEAAAMVAAGRTADHREASKAFVEKRPPVFRGR